MANNLLQLNPAQATDPNQQAYINWQNSILQSADLAKNLETSTLAGMALGQALGSWGGWKVGNWWKNLQEDLADKRRLKKLAEQGAKNIAADNQFVQDQVNWAKQNGINNPRPVSLLGGMINPQAVNTDADFSQPYNLEERLSNPYTSYSIRHPNASIAEINNAGNLDWRYQLNQNNPLQNIVNNTQSQLEKARYSFPEMDITKYANQSDFNPNRFPTLQTLGVNFGVTPQNSKSVFPDITANTKNQMEKTLYSFPEVNISNYPPQYPPNKPTLGVNPGITPPSQNKFNFKLNPVFGI